MVPCDRAACMSCSLVAEQKRARVNSNRPLPRTVGSATAYFVLSMICSWVDSASRCRSLLLECVASMVRNGKSSHKAGPSVRISLVHSWKKCCTAKSRTHVDVSGKRLGEYTSCRKARIWFILGLTSCAGAALKGSELPLYSNKEGA